MFKDYIQAGVEGFKGASLDNLLSQGYFRMLDEMFTTQSIAMGKYGNSPMMEPVFWLRTVLPQIKEKKAAKELRKKCAAFSFTIKDAAITSEFEELFKKYKSFVKFELLEITDEYDLSANTANPFDSKMIEVRDGAKLIAVGLFDLGNESIMGIRNIYHPEYHKFSLGKFLMLQKIDYAIINGIKYYYTGYIGTSNTKFDYKVFPDEAAVEVYMPFEKEWTPFSLKQKNELGIYFEKNVFGDLFDELL
jgi:leucyl-tRNA---protein transferase